MISRPSLSVRCLYPPSIERLSDFDRHEHLGAEPLRLHHRAPRQFTTAHACGKAKVIFDSGAGAGLPAGRVSIQQQCSQTLRRAVDGRGKPGRSGADDDEVVEVERSGKRAAKAFRHMSRLWITQRVSVFEKKHGKFTRADSRGIQQACVSGFRATSSQV